MNQLVQCLLHSRVAQQTTRTPENRRQLQHPQDELVTTITEERGTAGRWPLPATVSEDQEE
jgi:hypothetical protein